MSSLCPERARAAPPEQDAPGPRSRLTIATVLAAALARGRPALPASHWKTLHALLRCRTAALGGHLYVCADCGRQHFLPHSCRNRHCPACQRGAAVDWLDQQTAALLPVPYFHVVFTLPHTLNGLIAQNQRALYNLLFGAARATLLEFGRNHLQAQIGVTAVLHTWSQTLLDHYHLHCVVTGGGLRLDSHGWQPASARYLFPVRALAKVFRGKFCAGLQKLYVAGQLGFHGALAERQVPAAFAQLLSEATAQPWVVYSKRPFAGPSTVLAYLSRYTHRVALGAGRLRGLDDDTGTVCFAYKDYADHSRSKTLTLALAEFLRRFCLHLLPPRFVKIRHYGLLGNRDRQHRLAAARALLGAVLPSPPPAEEHAPAGPVPPSCPHCGGTRMILIEHRVPARDQPATRLAFDSS
jgi:hypothetical protein